ncbi:hypothetical protein RhiirA4_489133 [Rhizophagus irregularis]|uniref:Uncharacterized protein n=1 Tax=Rhizophagus irregularis TaxID=588596 RepID=A0A2I1HUH6_9GLOM|nr:hypothetical protein RhiirA4_489133 [Rhizophagus irregularis]
MGPTIQCGASAFKIIQTSKGRRKLVAYFENWETDIPFLDKKKSGKTVEEPVHSEEGKEIPEEWWRW